MASESTQQRGPVIGLLLHDFQLGGAERVAIRLANAWVQLGCRVVLFAGGAGGLQRQLLSDAVEVVVADPPLVRGLRASPARLAKWVAARAAGMDAFYLPGNSYFTAVGPLSVAGVRIYATITNSLWRIDRSLARNVVFALATRRRLRKAAGVMSMSPALLRQERRVLGNRIAMEAMPNALFERMPGWGRARRQRGRICAVGRLVPQKNFALLLHSFALLRDLPLTLDIAGDGPLRAELQQLAITLGVAERVRFLGAVANASGCMAEAEVVVLTSDYEGYPAVAVEALAAGAFVVSSNCSVGMKDILGGDLGVIVNKQQPAAFAAVLRQCFAREARNDAVKRQAMVRPLLESHVALEAARRHLQFMGLAPR
ncbi:MAG: glycosyltransferase [Pseudomonadota bacterium]